MGCNFITGQNEKEETTQNTTVTKSAACASYKSNYVTYITATYTLIKSVCRPLHIKSVCRPLHIKSVCRPLHIKSVCSPLHIHVNMHIGMCLCMHMCVYV